MSRTILASFTILCLLSSTSAIIINAVNANEATYIDQTYGGTEYDKAWFLVQTVDGGYALAGRTASFGAGGFDFWLVKTDGSGNHVWNQTYGGWRLDEAGSIVETLDGGYVLAGHTFSFGVWADDFWLVKTDGSGNHVWNQTYGGLGNDNAWSVVQTVDGGYALAGRTSSFGVSWDDFWLVKTDGSGNHEWNHTYGGLDHDYAYSIVEAVDGGYALAGYTDSFGAGDDVWLVKTDSDGNMEWNQTYGGAEWDYAYSVVQTVDGGYALAGYTDSFGAGSYDFWLVKTDQYGVIPELPAWTLLLAVIMCTVTIIIYRRKTPKTTNQ